MTKAAIDAATARALLAYDPLTGIIVKRSTGMPIGTNARGYLRASVCGRGYLCHRLAWLLHYGQWPTLTINHKNGVKDDNRIENLEDISLSENSKHAHATGLVCNVGSGNGRAVLTEADVLEIRSYKSNASTLAKKFGVTRIYIKDVRRGDDWKHIKTPPIPNGGDVFSKKQRAVLAVNAKTGETRHYPSIKAAVRDGFHSQRLCNSLKRGGVVLGFAFSYAAESTGAAV